MALCRQVVSPIDAASQWRIFWQRLRSFDLSVRLARSFQESLLYSELDEAARQDLATTWAFEEILCVPQATFKGTRAHSALIVLRPNNGEGTVGRVMAIRTRGGVVADLVRGGLPVHEAVLSPEEGVPFVHSTDLTALVDGSYRARSVCPVGRGCVVGAVILLPQRGSTIGRALSSDNQDENVATIKVRTRGRDATSARTMAVAGKRGKWERGERDGGHASACSADSGVFPRPRRGERSEPGRGRGRRILRGIGVG